MTFTENPETPTSPAPGATDLIPSAAQERVTVAPPPEWVTVRALDESVDATVAGAQLVLMLDRQFRVRGHERYERLVRCLRTVQAVHEAAQWRLDFDPGVQRVVIHSIAVRRGGQRVEQADVARLRFLQREENLDRFVVDGRVTVVLLIEDVRVGDILDVSYTVQTTPRLLPENFWMFSVVPAQVPLRAFHVSVRYPTSRPIKWKHSEDEFSPSFKKIEDESEWHWQLSDVRPREIEPGVPSSHLVNPWFQVSDCETWGQVAAGVCAAWSENFGEPEFVEVVNQIAAGAATTAECVNRALTFVQDEIRYLSLNSGLGGQIPASPGVVLRRRFGDCKDKAFLAAHLLRRLGVPARAVLVNSALRQSVDRMLPMPDAFDHVVVEYDLSGKRRWVDVTVPMQGGGALTKAVSDFRTGLPVSTGTTELERIASVTSLGDIYELRETFMIDTGGRPSGLKVMVKAAGAEADALRRELTLEGEAAVTRKREQFYRQFFPDIRRVGAMEWRDDRGRNELVIADMFELRSATVPGREAQTCVFEYRAHLIQSVLGFSDTGTRKQPFAVRYPCQVHHWIEVESPALEGAPPQTTAGRDSAFRFSCDFNRNYGRIIAHYSLRTLADSVKPERFDQFKTKIREIWPVTFLHVVLPLGVITSRRNRASGSLLPTLPPPSKRDKNKNGSASSESMPEVFAMPSAPSPALVGDVPASAEEVENAPQDFTETSDTAAPQKRTATPRSAAAFSDPTATASRPREKGKRRRTRKSGWVKGVRIGFYILLALIAVGFLIIANLRKG